MSRFVLAALAFVASLLLILPASAQMQTNINIKPFQVRLEVPSGVGQTVLLTNTYRIPTNGASGTDITGTNWVIASVNVGISGAPAGCTASLLASDQVTAVSTVPINLNTNNASANTNIILKLVFDGTQVSGFTNLVLTATGAGEPNAIFFLPLEVGKIWNGHGNAALNGAQNWSTGPWLGGVPGPNDTVVFNDLGAQTNTLFTIPVGVSTNGLLTNCIIDVNATLASLRFAQTNGTNTSHVLVLNSGVNLAITGSNGFSMLRDYTYGGGAASYKMNVTIAGTNGSFIETNVNANFSLMADGQAASVLDMSRLGNVQLDVNRVVIGDVTAYPNYWTDFVTNNFAFNGTTFGTALPNRVLPTWNMALTNYVRAWYVDPYNYNNAGNRSYAMILGVNNGGGGSSGAQHVVNMGNTNAFYLDGLCVAGNASLGGVLQFLNNNSYALFRNTNGGRMSIFAMGDAGGMNVGTNLTGDNTKCASPGVDFSKGTVDMQVDRLYMSMDRANVTSSGKGVAQSSLVLSKGIIDANTAILGYQSQGNQTNASNCNATMVVSNTAILRVNGVLSLGYTTASIGDISTPSATHGQLTIGPGNCTVIASNIDVGGVTKASTGNTITMVNGATLIVSNTMGSAVARGAVGSLSLGGNCTNEFFVDGTHVGAYMYVTNLSTTGAGNTIFIGSLNNLSYPAAVPLISYRIGTPTFGLAMPPGFTGSGALVTTTINGGPGYQLLVTTNPPKRLLWRGGNGTWDNTSHNWLDQDTSLMTNFINGDTVAFDDLSGSTINVDSGSSPIIPTSINMTNNTLSFVINGSGTIQGSAAFSKQGTQSLEIDASTTVPVLLNQGSLLGSGTIYGVTIAAGTTMSYGGTINGSVNCGGTATFLNSSTIAGQLTVLTNGIVINDSPNVDLAGLLSLQSGAYLTNTVNGVIDDYLTGTIATNALLINNGQLGNNFANVLTVNGTLKDLGGSGWLTVNTLTIAPGALFIPGGDNLGTSTVFKNGPTGTGLFPGSVNLQAGSTTILQVNAGNLAHTMLLAWANSFGPSASAQTQNGCTLVITNVSGTPFSAGQYFRLFENPNNAIIAGTGTSTNTYPVIVPATPGPGLTWDLRYLWALNASQNGLIGVVNAGAIAPQLTNNSITTIGGTNVVARFSWPAADLGWRLETQNNPLSIGLSNNWGGVPGSWTNLSMSITNSLTTNTAIFYRLSFP